MFHQGRFIRSLLVTGLGLSLASAALPNVSFPQGAQAPPKVKKVETVTGKLLGYAIGDYVYAIVKPTKGAEKSLMIAGGPEVRCFLSANVGKSLTLTVETVDTYLEEAGGRVTVEHIKDVRSASQSASAWFKAERKKGQSVDALLKKATKIEEKNNRAGRPMRLAQPIFYAIDGWVFAVQEGSKWSEPGKALDGTKATFQVFSRDRELKSVSETLKYDEEGGPLPSLDFEGKTGDLDSLYVSGGKAKLAKVVRISGKNATYLKAAKEYAASIGKSKMPTVLQGGVQADLDGDGSKDLILAVSSGAKDSKVKKEDYANVVLRTVVGGKLKTLDLVKETGFGLQYGPFQSKVIAVGDFDGNGKTEFLLKTWDAWGDSYRMFQLNKGRVKLLFTGGRGE